MTVNTLDPPGTIVILGGGPVGIEAALYARYLGYQVELLEKGALLQSLRAAAADTPPPEPCTSPLGLAAIAAQRGSGSTLAEITPSCLSEWIAEYWQPLAESDLLRGRLHEHRLVERIEWAPEEEDDDATSREEAEPDAAATDEEEPVPPDFLVFAAGAADPDETTPFRCEAILDARGSEASPLQFPAGSDEASLAYFHRLGTRAEADCRYAAGLRQIRDLFASLQDRPDLDVYKNLGG
jgi:glycine/D-amino acid oxidase-like deaminating enzyme